MANNTRISLSIECRAAQGADTVPLIHRQRPRKCLQPGRWLSSSCDMSTFSIAVIVYRRRKRQHPAIIRSRREAQGARDGPPCIAWHPPIGYWTIVEVSGSLMDVMDSSACF